MTAKRKEAKPKPKRIALAGSFSDKLTAWTAIVDEVVGAKTAVAAQKACARAESLDHIPVDLFNEDDCDERALKKAHVSWNAKIEARIESLGDQWDIVREVCNLRDLINDS